MPIAAALSLSGNQSVSHWLRQQLPLTYNKILPPAAALTATGELAGRVIVPWKCPGNTDHFWQECPMGKGTVPSVLDHQWFLLANLSGFPKGFQSGKNLILLCNNEAFPFHYFFLELHPSGSSLLPGFTSHPHLQDWQTCQLPWGQAPHRRLMWRSMLIVISIVNKYHKRVSVTKENPLEDPFQCRKRFLVTDSRSCIMGSVTHALLSDV